MKCYDCGHSVHGGENCLECGCPEFSREMDRLDDVLRQRPTSRSGVREGADDDLWVPERPEGMESCVIIENGEGK